METNNYLGLAVFAVFAIAAFIVGITTNNKIVLVAGYIFIVMAQIAYLIAYTKTIKREVDSIKQLLINKLN
jgi:succinate-acetate transporter protein